MESDNFQAQGLISICLPVYNCEKYIAKTLICLCGQTYPNIEIIVVNDGSTDGTKAAAESVKDERVTIIHSDNGGAARARNLAYQNAKGSYIIFFDADDYVKEDFVLAQWRKIEQREDIIVLSSWGRFYQDELDTFNLEPIPFIDLSFEDWVNYYWHNGSPMTTPGRALIPRKIIEKQGIWNENLSLNDDLEFFTRLFSGVTRLIINQDAIFYYRSGINGLSAQKSVAAYLSLYESVDESTKLVLTQFDNDEAVKQSCANLWQSTVYEIYPFEKDMVKSAELKIKNLGGSNLKYNAGGFTRILASLVGWKLTKRIKTIPGINLPGIQKKLEQLVPRCKIFLFTYKRNDLLPRAVEHLINQTFEDWTCEVHNDNPGNIFPGDLINSLNDPRFVVKDHERNLGGTTSFNLAFTECPFDYVSILEDDNWWEPEFLQTMINLMDTNPKIGIAWNNMHVWKETADRKWVNTHHTIWSSSAGDQIFTWPNPKQALGAIHSNGAMMFRGKNAQNYIIPDRCEFGIIEGIRERTFEYPIILLSKPLANFSLTLQTSRSKDPSIWTGSQIMLLASYIQAADDKNRTFEETLLFYRRENPTSVATFFLALLFIIKDFTFFKYFELRDWIGIGKWTIKNLFNFRRLKKYLAANREVYDFLITHTLKQTRIISHREQSVEP